MVKMPRKTQVRDDDGRKMEIARQIRKARVQRRVRQTALAERIGCSRAKLNRVEHGQAELTMLELDRLARALEVPVEFFFSVTV
jgi:transcriptional regulator with XRE-family HTH domain